MNLFYPFSPGFQSEEFVFPSLPTELTPNSERIQALFEDRSVFVKAHSEWEERSIRELPFKEHFVVQLTPGSTAMLYDRARAVYEKVIVQSFEATQETLTLQYQDSKKEEKKYLFSSSSLWSDLIAYDEKTKSYFVEKGDSFEMLSEPQHPKRNHDSLDLSSQPQKKPLLSDPRTTDSSSSSSSNQDAIYPSDPTLQNSDSFSPSLSLSEIDGAKLREEMFQNKVILMKHYGRKWVETKIGKTENSTFFFFLPKIDETVLLKRDDGYEKVTVSKMLKTIKGAFDLRFNHVQMTFQSSDGADITEKIAHIEDLLPYEENWIDLYFYQQGDRFFLKEELTKDLFVTPESPSTSSSNQTNKNPVQKPHPLILAHPPPLLSPSPLSEQTTSTSEWSSIPFSKEFQQQIFRGKPLLIKGLNSWEQAKIETLKDVKMFLFLPKVGETVLLATERGYETVTFSEILTTKRGTLDLRFNDVYMTFRLANGTEKTRKIANAWDLLPYEESWMDQYFSRQERFFLLKPQFVNNASVPPKQTGSLNHLIFSPPDSSLPRTNVPDSTKNTLTRLMTSIYARSPVWIFYHSGWNEASLRDPYAILQSMRGKIIFLPMLQPNQQALFQIKDNEGYHKIQINSLVFDKKIAKMSYKQEGMDKIFTFSFPSDFDPSNLLPWNPKTEESFEKIEGQGNYFLKKGSSPNTDCFK